MNITESMKLFLKELSDNRSAKTTNKYEYVLDLFGSYLANYAELSYEEHKDKGCLITADTKELHDGQVSNFLEWFLIRKVIGPQWLNTTAPSVIKAYIKWLIHQNLITDGAMDEIVETTKKASKDLPRVEKAANLLYKLYEENSGKFYPDKFKDDDYMEGYGEVSGMLDDKLFLDYEGEKIEPILITGEIAGYLKKGDTVNLVVGRKKNLWYPLEVGNVYPGQ